MKINNTTLSKIELPKHGQKFFYDSELKGFGAKATPGGITFIAQRKVNGKVIRHVLGRLGELSPAEARTKAAKAIGEMRDGINLNERKQQQRKEQQVNSLTLVQAYEEFKSSRELRPRSLQTYDYILKHTLSDWLDMSITNITGEMVLKKHKTISSSGIGGRGAGSANQVMRLLRTVFNFVIATKKGSFGKSLISENPVGVLSQLDSWNKLEPRDTIIKADDLKDWYQAVMGLESNKLQDFFLFLIFSGLRRNEAMCLQWCHFDTKSKTLTIPKELSKTKKKRQIPLTDVLLDIYKRRRAKIVVGNPYVFTGAHDKQHLTEPKRAVNLVKAAVTKQRQETNPKDDSTIEWSSHDLRRTYITIASNLDVSYYKLKYLVGHSVGGDVTGKHYAQVGVDDVRDAAQEVADFLKEKMGMREIALVNAN